MLQLYDPDRSQALSFNGEIRSWGEFAGALRDALAQQKAKNGAGIRILTETVTSPTHGRQLRAIQKLYPGRQVAQWEPAGPHSARAARRAGVRPAGQHVLRFQQRRRGGFAGCRLPGVRSRPACATRASSPRAAACDDDQTDTMNRLYVVEPMPTPTGTKADHRLPLRAGEIEEFAWALAVSLGSRARARRPARITISTNGSVRLRATWNRTRARAW